MNIKTRPLAIAAGVGFVFEILVFLGGQGVSFFAMSQMLNQSANPDVSLDLSQLSLIASGASCICGLFSALVAGAIYSLIYPRDEAFMIGDGALGGGAAAGLARLTSGALGLCASTLLTPFIYQQMLGAGSSMDIPVETVAPFLMVSVISGLVGGLIGLVVSIIFAGMLGALGGAVVGAVVLRSNPTV